jgi:hypothetical protein
VFELVPCGTITQDPGADYRVNLCLDPRAVRTAITSAPSASPPKLSDGGPSDLVFSSLCRNWRLNQTAELASKIHRHPGVHGALAVKKALRTPEGKDPFVPDVGMNIEALLAIEPEADEPFRYYIVAG